MVVINTKMLSLIGSLAVLLPAVSALPTSPELGCYSRGPTWDDFAKLDGTTADTLPSDVCSYLSDLPVKAGNQFNVCLQWPDHNNLHVDVTLRNIGSGTNILSYVQCLLDVATEINGCSHGSEQNHGNFWYKLDPNDGSCT